MPPRPRARFWAVYGFQPGGSPGPPQVGTYYQNYNFFCANVTVLDFLDSTSDPRLRYFFGVNSTGGYGGNVLGASNNPVGVTSPIGTGCFTVGLYAGLAFYCEPVSVYAGRSSISGNDQWRLQEPV